jgi:hypothetical protein
MNLCQNLGPPRFPRGSAKEVVMRDYGLVVVWTQKQNVSDYAAEKNSS